MNWYKRAQSLQVGKKLPKGWVYHHAQEESIPFIEKEGLERGSFTYRPGFEFYGGSEVWIAARIEDIKKLLPDALKYYKK